MWLWLISSALRRQCTFQPLDGYLFHISPTPVPLASISAKDEIEWSGSNLQALPMASRNDCLLALTSGSTFCRSRTAGGFGRLRSVGGGGSCRDLIASESTGGSAAPADAALRRSTSPFLTGFSESLLPVSHKVQWPVFNGFNNNKSAGLA